MARRTKKRMKSRSKWHRHLIKAHRKSKKHARRKRGFGGRLRRKKG